MHTSIAPLHKSESDFRNKLQLALKGNTMLNGRIGSKNPASKLGFPRVE